MAEILVLMRDNTNPDPKADQMCHKRGDPIVVEADGHPWGRMEGAPDFVVVKMPGDLLDLRERLLHPERSTLIFDPENPTEGVLVGARRCRFDLAAFADSTVRTMERDGEITLSRRTAEARFIDKGTGTRALTEAVR